MTVDGERKPGSFIVFLLVFAAVGALGRNTVIPAYETKMALRQIDEALAGNVALEALKRYDIASYQKLLDPIKQSVIDRKPTPEIIDQTLSTLIGIMRQKLPQASDESARKYMSLMSAIITRAAERNPNDCYELLHPSASYVQLPLNEYVSAQQQKEQQAAMAEVISSASMVPQRIPLESEVRPLIEPMMEELIRLYGKDVLMLLSPNKNASLNNSLRPNAPAPDKGRICQMEAAWLRLALRQPPNEAATVLRYMVSVSGTI